MRAILPGPERSCAKRRALDGDIPPVLAPDANLRKSKQDGSNRAPPARARCRAATAILPGATAAPSHRPSAALCLFRQSVARPRRGAATPPGALGRSTPADQRDDPSRTETDNSGSSCCAMISTGTLLEFAVKATRSFSAHCARRIALAVFSVHLSQAVFSQSVFVEDWDSTPAVPDEVRGWGSVEGAAELESGLGTGNFVRAQRIFIPPNALAVPFGNDPSTWFSNEYVGDKNYAQLEVAKVSFLARHDAVDGASQPPSLPASFVLVSGEMVPDPADPSEMIFPLVWVISENRMFLGDGWAEFQFDIPSNSETLPEGWQAYPDEPSTWASVISDVDQLGVVFGPFGIGVGGVPSIWENAIDNFTVEFGRPRIVPSISNFGISLLIALVLGVGVLAARRSQIARPRLWEKPDREA